LVDFNPAIPAGVGFTFNDLKAEIDAGYPVMLFLQDRSSFYRDVLGGSHMNPEVHGMIAYGYRVLDDGRKFARYRTSWGSGDNRYHEWSDADWEVPGLTLRGVIAFHPKPQITTISKVENGVSVKWDGPAATTFNGATGATLPVHWYVLEKATSLTAMDFTPVSDASASHEAVVNADTSTKAFFRVKLLDRSQIPAQ
jgi:hypothetical protein